MFAKLSVVAALALAPWVQALFLQTPVDWHSSSDVNITWTHNSTDVPFAFQLANTDEFHDTFSIANNLQPSADFASFQLGVVPAGQYTLRAINQTNENQIYDETPSFTIAAPISSTVSSSSTSSAASSTASGSGSVSGSATLTVTPSSGSSTSGFGVTVSASSTAPGSSGTSNASGTSSSSSGASPSSFNNGAAALPRVAPLAFAALGVVAGAAIVL
ncbi:hypothetical protein L226DRAFT_607334 [Lentinus tigrinus ALCF2SS1-7]|uniref:Ser-Thr-rich glycosyl-phosphatidyl-inositol-anchored membrane family-domain-containing protein n=1 Tax=Lentinus tigrinus ALCF2SS1-6 TaxID=1328759 RepID=A0A5C2SN81_9APHY|nr:hypothetical protein L227DRAFT_571519 [Lentinus tigrinus ALCF2SS1-6]RPD82163.1 hypothetical protein L226DRAFT_607334 [Lentinus tigrinus ALCF2SS1-7]